VRKKILLIVLFSILSPLVTIAEDSDMGSSDSEFSSPPVEELSAPTDATPTESSSMAPEAMEEATFDDVSYE
jgi:hypothetical protein